MKFYHQYDIVLLVCIYACIACGIFTLYSQEAVLQYPPERWLKQLSYALLGSIFLFALHNVNYNYFASHAFSFYVFTIFLLLLTLIPGVGTEINGARSWLRISGFGFQTSELAKISTIILLAAYLSLKEKEMHQLSALLIPFGIAVLPMCLILMQPDFGSAFSLMPILLAMLIIAGADLYHILPVMVFFLLSLGIPLYVEYHNITLIPALLKHLEDIDQRDLLPAVRILKTDIWSFINQNVDSIRGSVQDKVYLTRVLQSQSLMAVLEDSAKSVRYQAGGFLLIFLEQARLLFILGSSCAFSASLFWIFRLARGVAYKALRKIYIPVGILGISFIAAGAFQSFVTFRPHQVARITAFINPEKFPRDLAYQIRASKAAIGSGEFIGRGFWKGEMTLGRYPLVPEAHTDFIFTSWAERTGFLGSLFLILILITIPLKAFLLSSEARDRFASLLSCGISLFFSFHIIVNIGIGLGLLPVTGLPLSFVSYGGSHLVVCMAAIGILMNIYRKKFAHGTL